MARLNLGRVTGQSAYEIAVKNGFKGTESEWLESLKAPSSNSITVNGSKYQSINGDITLPDYPTLSSLGAASLGTDGKIPASQLPSYVDDIIEGYYYNRQFFTDTTYRTPITGESGKIYIDLSTNKTFRWSGSTYVEITASVAIGTTSGSAMDGKIGTDHINNKNNPHNVTAADVGLGLVNNTADAQKEVYSAAYLRDSRTGSNIGINLEGITAKQVAKIPVVETENETSMGYMHPEQLRDAMNAAAVSHTHTGYAPTSHTHSEYALASAVPTFKLVGTTLEITTADYTPPRPIERKISKTSNIDESGNSTYAYGNNLKTNDIVTFPGALSLDIKVWCSTEDTTYDWLAIYPGGVTPTENNPNEATISNGKIGGGKHGTLQPIDGATGFHAYHVMGDTAQFFFRSDSSEGYYGYYAIVTPSYTGGTN